MERLGTIDEIIEKYCVASSPLKSRLYVGLGTLFLGFAVIGIWVPGWPTVSWAVPAAFLFSISNQKMFRLTLSNRYFGPAMFEYYATGKTIPGHAKTAIVAMIAMMSAISAYLVWLVSTKGDWVFTDPSSWNGADPGYGYGTILIVGLVGILYIIFKVRGRGEH